MVPLNKTLKFILSGEYIYNKGEDLEAVYWTAISIVNASFLDNSFCY